MSPRELWDGMNAVARDVITNPKARRPDGRFWPAHSATLAYHVPRELWVIRPPSAYLSPLGEKVAEYGRSNS